MKKTKGQANPQLANEIFQRLLGEDKGQQIICRLVRESFRGLDEIIPPATPLTKGGLQAKDAKPKTKNGVKMIPYCSICWDIDKVKLLDQRQLPREEIYLDIRDYREIIEAIRTLAIRGAPAIGVAAAMGAALGALALETEDHKRVPIPVSGYLPGNRRGPAHRGESLLGPGPGAASWPRPMPTSRCRPSRITW